MRLETHSVLTNNLIIEIEEFLLRSVSKFNPLFSSPVWADRLRELIAFDYRYIIVRDDGEIIASNRFDTDGAIIEIRLPGV